MRTNVRVTVEWLGQPDHSAPRGSPRSFPRRVGLDHAARLRHHSPLLPGRSIGLSILTTRLEIARKNEGCTIALQYLLIGCINGGGPHRTLIPLCWRSREQPASHARAFLVCRLLSLGAPASTLGTVENGRGTAAKVRKLRGMLVELRSASRSQSLWPPNVGTWLRRAWSCPLHSAQWFVRYHNMFPCDKTFPGIGSRLQCSFVTP